MPRDPDPNRAARTAPPGARRPGAARLAARALVAVVAVAVVAAATTRILRPSPAVHTHAYGTTLREPTPAGRPCRAAVDAACARAVATRVGVTVAWLPDAAGWRGAGVQSGGSGGHGWATETLRTDHARLAVTSNSPAVETGDPVAVAGAAGLAVRIADGGRRVQLIWSHGGTRYVADARADAPTAARDLGSLADTWHRVRYASPVTGWS